jgi:predicted transcriptional regulator
MVDFACKQIDKKEIIKCAFGLTKTEVSIFFFFLKHEDKTYSSTLLSKLLQLDLTTIQKAVKKLHQRGVLKKYQKNLEKSGYVFEYQIIPKDKIKEIISKEIQDWVKKVEAELCKL